jgi:uncharacterized membrane protein YdjX (TVP38/TMEM64 family)
LLLHWGSKISAKRAGPIGGSGFFQKSAGVSIIPRIPENTAVYKGALILSRKQRQLKFLSSAGILAALLLLVYADPPTVRWAHDCMNALGHLYSFHPVLAIFLFCVLHLVASVFGVPGACTTLNFTSGAVFGFWMGCFVVYPITLVSALLGYALGHWSKRATSAHALGRLFRLGATSNLSYLDLIALRISPFVPFNLVNIFLGSRGISLLLFLSSSVVGIFFDVVLLNGLGAGMMKPASAGRGILVAVFLLIFLLSRGVVALLGRRVSRVGNAQVALPEGKTKSL